ncbi:MAG: hypothetical protein COT15_05260 [Candidatus Diapherotrites archaeon CG08_land_8_20_14_0_20_34_12]|nr:MAG: hypothetical protein COT15_05260 [Candidatus Diapherotrites archaeon CG08_land_8_20_14_0_20_34_12]
MITQTIFASLNYDVNLIENNAEVNMQIELISENAANVFQSKMQIPETAGIISIKDSGGEIKDYTLNEGELTFKTNYSIAKEKEIADIKMKWPDIVDKSYFGLNCSKLSFSGIKDTETTVDIEGNKIISFEASAGFDTYYSENKITVKGEGPVNIYLCYSDKGLYFKHYVLFGETVNLSETQDYFDIIPLVLGIMPAFSRFPIVVMNDEDYAKEVNEYSQGTHMPGGVLIVKRSLFDDKQGATNEGIITAIHETVHSFNELAFRWNNTKSSFFDEGIAKMIESIALKKAGAYNAKLFYGEVQYAEGNKLITLLPKGDVEDLLDYYVNDRTFMIDWDPSISDKRAFSYGYGELYAKKYVMDHGLYELQKAYREFVEIKESMDSEGKVYDKINAVLGVTEQPCYLKSLQALKDCLNNANAYDIILPQQTNVLIVGQKELAGTKETSIEEIKEIKKQKILDVFYELKKRFNSLFEKVIEAWKNSIKNIAEVEI